MQLGHKKAPGDGGFCFAACHHASGSPRVGLLRRRVIDLKIVELAGVTRGLAGDAEFEAGFGGVGDARRLEVTDGLAVEDDADLVVDDFDDEVLPFARLDVGGECHGATDDELLALGLTSGILEHGADFVLHVTIAFVDDLDGTLLRLGVITDLGATDVAVVGGGVFTVVEFDVHHRGAVELDADFDDGILGGELEAMDGGVALDDALAVLGGLVLQAGLHALEGAFSDGEGRDDLDPALVGGAREIIGEEQFALLGDGFGRDGRSSESCRGEKEREEGAHGESRIQVQRCKSAKVKPEPGLGPGLGLVTR